MLCKALLLVNLLQLDIQISALVAPRVNEGNVVTAIYNNRSTLVYIKFPWADDWQFLYFILLFLLQIYTVECVLRLVITWKLFIFLRLRSWNFVKDLKISTLVFSVKMWNSITNDPKKEGLLSKPLLFFLALSFFNHSCKCRELTAKFRFYEIAESKDQCWEYREGRMDGAAFIGR